MCFGVSNKYAYSQFILDSYITLFEYKILLPQDLLVCRHLEGGGGGGMWNKRVGHKHFGNRFLIYPWVTSEVRIVVAVLAPIHKVVLSPHVNWDTSYPDRHL
jgi:hypothetical protein